MLKLERKGYSRKAGKKLRYDVMIHLGGAVCVKCGYDNMGVLCIDHIYDDGAEERKNIKNIYIIYRRILNSSEDEMLKRYQVLCRNCNWLKELERVERENIIKKEELESKIRECDEMTEHYRRIQLPFGLEL